MRKRHMMLLWQLLCFKSMHPISKSVAKITLFVLVLERLTGAPLTAFMALVDIGILPTELTLFFTYSSEKY